MRMLQKKYIGIVLLLLVAVSASAQKAERDYIRKGNRFFKDSVYVIGLQSGGQIGFPTVIVHLFYRFRRYRSDQSQHVCLLVSLHQLYEPCTLSSIFLKH